MTHRPRKMSEMLKEMSEVLLRNPTHLRILEGGEALLVGGAY